MPPKSSSKKNQASWYHCETCGVHITSKARDSHDASCPIPSEVDGESDSEVEYVRNGTLYTRSLQQRNFEVESLKDLPAKYANMLVFVSEGAMRLSQLHIGQHVVIESTSQEQLVRIVWPVSEQFLTTVFVTDNDYKSNWTNLRGKLLKIRALDTKCLTAAGSISLKLISESRLKSGQLKDATALLQRAMVNQIYCQGTKIHLNFFNKSLTFRLESWQGAVEDALAGLSLEAKSLQFVQVTNVTRVQLIPQEDEEDKLKEQTSSFRITKSQIGGLDKQVELVEESMEYALGLRTLPAGLKVSRGMLLYGATGCGKSMVLEAITAVAEERSQRNVQIIRLNSGEVYSKFLGETEQNLAAIFERAYAHYPQPTLLLIEDVHNLCPKQESNDLVKRVSLAFLSLLDQLSSPRQLRGSRTFLLATSSQIDALHPSIRRAGRLDSELELGVPSPQARQAIIQCLIQSVEHQLSTEDVAQIATISHGYVGADLANLVYTALLQAQPQALQLKNLQEALISVKPSAMREVLIECPNVQWSDIGGQSELRLAMQQAIEWPLLHAEKFQRLGIKPPRGILMFGPPGCSKTMIAKALATESKLNFLSIKGPELFSMWVGESERAVREVFRKARQVAPSIVFFDEIDAIGGERAEGDGSGSGSSVKERVLTQLLTELDGVEALQNVTIVAATNRPDLIDKALLRPGRIDRILYVGLPKADARSEILHIKLRTMPLAKDVQVDKLVELTDGYSGAEIQAVCHEAAMRALEQSFEAEQVDWSHFEHALTAVQPRTSPELLKLYEDYLKRK
ncbi:ATPase family protein 2 homolog [Drosophila guanche]|uniref:Blast:Spermatogenesis-associated protein 5 n=1 Tax=Drosophila guanche TaxID=7266 RepID=A0A3B0KES4_DROGU|nr:ATPase family protein 2 homolog [Drosophila guanche]SPP82098.1 blast:Spermatogenesis-associated protein 5 [Drosophila guanche]